MTEERQIRLLQRYARLRARHRELLDKAYGPIDEWGRRKGGINRAMLDAEIKVSMQTTKIEDLQNQNQRLRDQIDSLFLALRGHYEQLRELKDAHELAIKRLAKANSRRKPGR